MNKFPEGFQPLLACRDTFDTSTLKFPIYASPKLDGIRAVTSGHYGGPRVFSRSLKLIPNLHVQKVLADVPHHLDGELITFTDGKLDDFSTISSKIMSSKGEPDVQYAVFDAFRDPSLYTRGRLEVARVLAEEHPLCHYVHQVHVGTPDLLSMLHSANCDDGYEGTMVRSHDGPYKFGRSTLREGILLKIKPWPDDEAVVTTINEEMANGNEKQQDVFGRAKRSTAAEGKVGKGRMGSLTCSWRGVEFDLGTGFSALQRQEWWDKRGSLIGATVTFKFQGVGTQGRPRFPVYKGIRHAYDISERGA